MSAGLNFRVLDDVISHIFKSLFFWITMQINMEIMEVVSLPGQLAACCADRQRLAYLIHYSTTVYHRNFAPERQGFPLRAKPWVWRFPFQSVPDGFLLAPANSKMSFQRLKMIWASLKSTCPYRGGLPLRSRKAWRTYGKHVPIAEFVPYNELY